MLDHLICVMVLNPCLGSHELVVNMLSAACASDIRLYRKRKKHYTGEHTEKKQHVELKCKFSCVQLLTAQLLLITPYSSNAIYLNAPTTD